MSDNYWSYIIDNQVFIEYLYSDNQEDTELSVSDYVIYYNNQYDYYGWSLVPQTANVTQDEYWLATHNTANHQLIFTDIANNKWSPWAADSNLIQNWYYQGLNLNRWDEIRIWWPTGWSWSDRTEIGFYFRLFVLDRVGRDVYLTNWFWDRTQSPTWLELMTTVHPPRFESEQTWQGYISIRVPSVQAIIEDNIDQQKQPNPSSLNYHLTGTSEVGIDPQTNINLQWGWINQKRNLSGNLYYYLGSAYPFSVSTQVGVNSVGLEIKAASDGEYFIIQGLCRNSVKLFEDWLLEQFKTERFRYIAFEVELWVNGLRRYLSDYPLGMDLLPYIHYRPVLPDNVHSCQIKTRLKMVTTHNQAQYEKVATYSLNSEQIASAGKRLLKLQLPSAGSVQLIRDDTRDRVSAISPTQINAQPKEIKILVPVLYERHFIVVQSPNQIQDSNGVVYFGMGELEVVFYHYHNVLQFNIASNLGGGRIEPWVLPGSSSLSLIVITNNNNLEVPMNSSGSDANASQNTQGIFYFELDENHAVQIANGGNKGQFHIVLINSQRQKSLLYQGQYTFSN